MKLPSLALIVLALAVMSGCTAFGFGFDDPEGEVSLVGPPNEGCEGGGTFYFGAAKNTGGIELNNVKAWVDVYGGNGAFLGRWGAMVSTGVEIIELPDEEPISIIEDDLDPEQTGHFNIQTTVGCGSAAREEYSFTFTAIDFEDL